VYGSAGRAWRSWLLVLFGGLQGLQVKKGQILGYIEQLGTFVEIKVS
jgi:hypothetical protein